MPAEIRDAIDKADLDKDFDNENFIKAYNAFMDRYCYSPDLPESLRRPAKEGFESYTYAWGENEFAPDGTLHDYDYREQMKHCDLPVMIMSGAEDLCSPVIAKDMHENIPNSEWHLFPRSRHMCYLDQHDEYVEIMTEWLNRHDA